jgi:hypothetical protein
VCLFVADSASDIKHVGGKSDDVVQAITFQMNVTFAFKKTFIEEIEQDTDDNGTNTTIRRSLQRDDAKSKTTLLRLRNSETRALVLQKKPCDWAKRCCDTGNIASCCSKYLDGATNGGLFATSALCNNGNGCNWNKKCKRKKPKKSISRERELLAISADIDLFEKDFKQVVENYTDFVPEITRAIVGANSTEDVATCTVHRYVDELNTTDTTFSCEVYEEHECADNEDIKFNDTATVCESVSPTLAPSVSPTSSPSKV